MKEQIYEKLMKIEWLMRRQQMQHQSEFGAFADRTRGQGRVLALLQIQPEMNAKDLSNILGIRQQSLNELLNKLEKSGFIIRQPSPEDKRVLMIQLTEKGKAVKQSNPVSEALFNDFSAVELSTFQGYLDRLITALEAEVGPEDEHLLSWMNDACQRMGEEKFKQLMTLHRGCCGGFGRHKHFGKDCHKTKGQHCCQKNSVDKH